jgi:hypothetical protein
VVSGYGKGAAGPRQMNYQETNESEPCDEASSTESDVKSKIHIYLVISTGVTYIRPGWHPA